MGKIQPARFGASLTAALAVLISACTSASGAGLPSAGLSSAPVEPASTEIAPSPTIEAPAPFMLPDITSRPISVNDLATMLPIGDTGPAATEGRVSIPRTNEDLITAAVMDRSDEVSDIDLHGRVTGVAAAYPSDAGTAHIWIDVFETSEGAAGWVTDTAEDIAKRVGGSHQASIDLSSAVDYPIEVGQGPVGLILSLDDGTLSETLAMFNLGRIAVFISIVTADDRDQRVPIKYLSEEVEARVLGVLMGTSPSPPASEDPDSYEFAYERIVEIGDATWTARASGTVDGDAVACRVTLDHPPLRVDRDLIWVGGKLWVSDGSGDYLRRSTAAVIDSQLLAMCPAWPVDVASAGLASAITGIPADHEIGGIPARGYRGTEADLEQALGVSSSAATIQVFNLWIAEGTTWMIEIDLTLSGDTTMLAQLIGVGFLDGELATVTLSQRVTAIGEAGRVIPPG